MKVRIDAYNICISDFSKSVKHWIEKDRKFGTFQGIEHISPSVHQIALGRPVQFPNVCGRQK